MDADSVAFSSGKEMDHFCFPGVACTQVPLSSYLWAHLVSCLTAYCNYSQKEEDRIALNLLGDPKHNQVGRHLPGGRSVVAAVTRSSGQRCSCSLSPAPSKGTPLSFCCLVL